MPRLPTRFEPAFRTVCVCEFLHFCEPKHEDKQGSPTAAPAMYIWLALACDSAQDARRLRRLSEERQAELLIAGALFPIKLGRPDAASRGGVFRIGVNFRPTREIALEALFSLSPPSPFL